MTPTTDPYRPTPTALAELRPDGLFVRRAGVLPSVCLMCGSRKRLERRDHLFERPSFVAWVIPNPAAILASLVAMAAIIGARRAAQVTLPHWRCSGCELRARDLAHALPFLALGALTGLGAAILVGLEGAIVWAVVIGLASVGIVSVIYRTLHRRLLSAVSLEDDGVVLRGVHPKAAKVLLAEVIAPDEMES